MPVVITKMGNNIVDITPGYTNNNPTIHNTKITNKIGLRNLSSLVCSFSEDTIALHLL